ncbi:MAG: hypothetical protein PHO00_01295 [bacterium]|nr:hypothetical protein [bacterium]
MRSKKVIFIFVIIFMLAVLYYIQLKIINMREEEKLYSRIYLRPGEQVTGVLLGGFRGIAADILWIQIDEYWHHGQWYKCLPLYKAVAYLQPNFLDVWSIGGWHMAYNICYEAGVSPYRTIEERIKDQYFWVQQGLDFLKTGIEHNPDVFNLYFELGWTYFNKVKDYRNAARYFKDAARYDCPLYVKRMYAHALYESGDIEGAKKTWKEMMNEMNAKEKKAPLKSQETFHRNIAERFYNNIKNEPVK